PRGAGPRAGACRGVAAPTDGAGAEERRDLGVTPPLRKREAVTCIGERARGVAAIARVAGKQRPIAQILAAAAAIRADAAGEPEPGDADALTYCQSCYSGP